MTTRHPLRHTVLFIGLAGVLLASCAAGDPRFTAAEPAGFFTGLWHGLISFVTLVIGLFDDDVQVYERANTGGWYDLGFLLGVTCWGGSARESGRAWRNGRSRRSAAKVPGHGHLKVDVTWDSDEAASKEGAATAVAPVEAPPAGSGGHRDED